MASPRNGRTFASISEADPGNLYGQAMDQMAKTLGARGGAKGIRSRQQWVTYLNSIVRQQAKPEDLPPERLQELYTLAHSMDSAGQGGLKGMLDILTQRFKSLEQKSLGQKELSGALEIVDTSCRGLASKEERLAANKLQLTDLRLRESQSKLRGQR